MSFVQAFVGSPLAGALGWTLLHSLWQGALAAALLAALLVATRSARIRYAAACAAMLLMAGAFIITLIRLLPETLPAHHPRALAITASLRIIPGASDPWDDRGLSAL